MSKIMKCTYCGRHTDKGHGTTWDHIRPLSKGGLNERVNKVICCRDCNQLKKDKMLYIWLYDLQVLQEYKLSPPGYNLGIIGRMIENIKTMTEHL
jgi:hypothetical protein